MMVRMVGGRADGVVLTTPHAAAFFDRPLDFGRTDHTWSLSNEPRWVCERYALKSYNPATDAAEAHYIGLKRVCPLPLKASPTRLP